jgi:biotin transport system substrate-specific component
MARKSVSAVLSRADQFSIVERWSIACALAIAGSIFVAICARISLPLPTPVPITLSNFAVLVVGLLLGSRLGFAALILYLLEGSVGLPVFSNGSLGLLGPSGGYLMAYPAVALLVGAISEHGPRSFVRAFFASLAGEVLLFAIGIAWLVAAFHISPVKAVQWGLVPFWIAEIAKVAAAAGLSTRLPAWRKH